MMLSLTMCYQCKYFTIAYSAIKYFTIAYSAILIC